MTMLSRRTFLQTACVAALGACGAPLPGVQPARADTLPEDLRPVQTAAFSRWVANFRPRALSQGISPATFDAAFADAGYIPGVVARDGNQIQTDRKSVV